MAGKHREVPCLHARGPSKCFEHMYFVCRSGGVCGGTLWEKARRGGETDTDLGFAYLCLVPTAASAHDAHRPTLLQRTGYNSSAPITIAILSGVGRYHSRCLIYGASIKDGHGSTEIQRRSTCAPQNLLRSLKDAGDRGMPLNMFGSVEGAGTPDECFINNSPHGLSDEAGPLSMIVSRHLSCGSSSSFLQLSQISGVCSNEVKKDLQQENALFPRRAALPARGNKHTLFLYLLRY